MLKNGQCDPLTQNISIVMLPNIVQIIPDRDGKSFIVELQSRIVYNYNYESSMGLIGPMHCMRIRYDVNCLVDVYELLKSKYK